MPTPTMIRRPSGPDEELAVEPVRNTDSVIYLLSRAAVGVCVVLFVGLAAGNNFVAVNGAIGVGMWLAHQLRARARRQLTDKAIRGLQRLLGHDQPHRKQLEVRWRRHGRFGARRWTGWWTGSPLKVRLHYSPRVVDDAGAGAPVAGQAPVARGAQQQGGAPTSGGAVLTGGFDGRLGAEWIAEVGAALRRRFGADYEVARYNRAHCWIDFRLVPPAPPAPETPPPPAEVTRGATIITSLLKTDLPVRSEFTTIEREPTTEERKQLQQSEIDVIRETTVGAFEFDLTPDVSAKLVHPAARHRFERGVSAPLPGRWRVKVDLENDYVRIERRPTLPTVIPHPAPSLSGDLYRIPNADDEDGRQCFWDMRRAAHKMVIGRTGSGKTVSMTGQILEVAARGWPVWICDAKGTEFLGLRDWPNVQIVATSPEEQIAVLYAARRLMQERYQLVMSGQMAEHDFEPLVLVLDEYREFFEDAQEWYSAVKVTGMPAKCPVPGQLASIARKGRAANLHVLLGTQRPDADFMTGEMRDNLPDRETQGPLSRHAAAMAWESQFIGVSIPRGVPGRATVLNPDGDPVEAQTYWTPDPRRPGRGPLSRAEDEQILARLRPREAAHPRLRVHIPGELEVPRPPAKMAPEWWRLIHAELVPMLGDDHAVTQEHTSTPALEAPIGITSAQHFAPEGPPADLAATPDEEDLEEDDPLAGYDPPEPINPADLRPGDLVLDEDSGKWVVVEASEPDLFDTDRYAIDWRGDNGVDGQLDVPAGEPVMACRPSEDTAA